MEETVKKISATVMGILTVIVSIAVINLSATQASMGEADKISDLQMMDTETAEEREIPENQIQMELPEGVTLEDIEVENNVFTQTVSITIPGMERDYYRNHSLLGRSNHIDDLIIDNDDESVMIEISFDEVYEIQTNVKESWLYVDFVSPREIYEKVLVIDAGHGGTEPGAIKKGIQEKDLNLAILLELKTLLDAHDNWKVYYTRIDDSDVSLQDRVELANNSHANLFLSIHNNSIKSGKMSKYNGTLVMYDEKKQEELLGTKRFSEICLEEIVGVTGSRNLGLMNGNSIYIIRTSEVPVALTEIGFMTSAEELKKLNTPEYQKLVAQGLYNGIVRAFEEGF